LYTSCDLITTIYYVVSKQNKTKALEEVQRINDFCHVIEFSNTDINQTGHLMLQDSDSHDLEDTVHFSFSQNPFETGDAIVIVNRVIYE
jgi:hypothetical protein